MRESEGGKRTLKTKSIGDILLPDKQKELCEDFFSYATLLYGRPGVGKTTFGASFKDAIVFSCERVSKGIRCYDFNAENGGVKDWKTFLRGVELLEQNKGRFKTVVIDTVFAAYAMCLRHVCKEKGIEHPQDEAYGKAWDAVKQGFSEALDRIWKSGRGIVFLAHAKEVEITAASGEKYTRIQPALQGQAYDYIKAKTDFVLYAEFVKDRKGKQRRIIITTGDEIVDAKHADCGNGFPLFLPLEKEGGAGLLARAFAGEDVGISAEEIRSSVQTSKVGSTFLVKQRAKQKGGKE